MKREKDLFNVVPNKSVVFFMTYIPNRGIFPSVNILIGSCPEGAVTDTRHEHSVWDIETKSLLQIVNASQGSDLSKVVFGLSLQSAFFPRVKTKKRL
jgi:hypothetical protein